MTEPVRPIIIKRKKVVAADGHHGGAWKVAYADFVTAMMAFFLLMWLLNATTEEQRKGIADYFSPDIPLASVSGGGADALSGDTIFTQSKMAQSGRGSEKDKANRGRQSDGEGAQKATDPAQVEARMTAMNTQLETLDPELARQVTIYMSPDGLVIELIDEEDSPLFTMGSAKPSPVLNTLTDVLVNSLADIGNKVKIVGHTDMHGFGARNDYSNWELSSDRANAARRLLAGKGFPADQIAEVSGKAATMPYDKDPYSARNRRISITLLSAETPKSKPT